MKRRKKKLNKVDQQYRKERRRVQQFIRRANKRGYQFTVEIPKIPKRITLGSVRRLQRLTPEYLYKKSLYGGEASFGEVVSGTEGRKLEKKLATERMKTTKRMTKERVNEDKDFFSKVVISNFQAHYSKFNERVSGLLDEWLANIISKYGYHDTAVMLEEGARKGVILTYQVAYESTLLHQYMADMLDYLPDSGDFFRDQLQEAMEESEYYQAYWGYRVK